MWNVENSLHPKRIQSRADSFSPLAYFDSGTLADWALVVMTVRCQAHGCWDGETWNSCTLRELLWLETHTLFLQLLPRCRNSPGHLICWRIWHGFRYTAERWDRDGIEVWKMAFADYSVFPIHLSSGWWDMIHDFTSIWKTYEATFTSYHQQEVRADKSRCCSLKLLSTLLIYNLRKPSFKSCMVIIQYNYYNNWLAKTYDMNK